MKIISYMLLMNYNVQINLAFFSSLTKFESEFNIVDNNFESSSNVAPSITSINLDITSASPNISKYIGFDDIFDNIVAEFCCADLLSCDDKNDTIGVIPPSSTISFHDDGLLDKFAITDNPNSCIS